MFNIPLSKIGKVNTALTPEPEDLPKVSISVWFCKMTPKESTIHKRLFFQGIEFMQNYSSGYIFLRRMRECDERGRDLTLGVALF